jgi:NNP family nitrate/nitrite transporter-like MFS transporter
MGLNHSSLDQGKASSRVLFLSTTAFTLLFAVWLMFGVLGVSIKSELHLDKVHFAWLTAIAVLSGSLLRLPFGLLADRIGGKRVFTALLLFTAVPCAAVSFVHSYQSLMILAFLFGIAGNSFSAGIAWTSAWFSHERQGVALGVFGAGNVGASVTKLIGPALIAAIPAAGFMDGIIPGGWRFVPVLYSVLLVTMAAVVWFVAPSPERRPAANRSMASLLAPLRVTRVWRFGLYYVVVFGAYVAFSLWLPNYYKTVYALPLSKAALLTAFFIFPASLLRPLGGWMSDKLGARPVTYGVFIAMVAACIPLGLPKGAFGITLSLGQFFAFIEILSIGMGIGKASVYKYVPEYFPKDVGAVGGLVGSLGALGGFLMPICFGYLDEATHIPQSCFWVMLAALAVSLGWLHTVVLGIKRRRETPVLGITAESATSS